MKIFLSVLLLISSFISFSQTVQISGRCYYDVNGNYLFDGTDSVLANRQIHVNHSDGITYLSSTSSSGEYFVAVPVGSCDIKLIGNVAYADYNYIGDQHRDYTSGGSDVVDFAYQKVDSIVSIYVTIQPVNINNVSSAGGIRQYNLIYGYNGLLQSMPATVKLNFNPKLIFAGASITPNINQGGKLQWNIPSVQRYLYNYNALDTIIFSLNYPAVGDTIGSFTLSPEFIPGITVSKPYTIPDFTDFSQDIDFPAPQPIGSTSGVKWLRQFGGPAFSSGRDEECVSIDTTQNGEGYFIAGYRMRIADSTGNGFSPAFIASINKEGLSVWEKYLDSLPGFNNFDEVSAIKHTADGGCLVLGNSYYTDPTGVNMDGVIISRFDSLGTLIWTKLLHGSNPDNGGEDIVVLPDGSSLISGYTNSHDGAFQHNHLDTISTNLFVTKLSASGTILFTKIYGGSKDDYGYKIKPLQNGSFLLLGGTESNNGDVVGAHQHGFTISNGTDTAYNSEAWILNIDGNGNILWSKCFGGSKDSYLVGAADNNGGILLTGVTDSKDGDLPAYTELGVTLWALQISTTGTIIWSKLHKLYNGYKDTNYIKSPIEFLYNNSIHSSLHKTKDGNFVAGGIAADKYGTIKGKHGKGDFVIVKLNTTGDIIWQKAIGGTYFEYLNDIQVDKNDDILFVGSSRSDDDDLYQHSATTRALAVVGKMGITNIIKGRVFIDNNGNHTKEAGENFYSEGRINSIKRTDTITARIFDGRFLNNVDTGNYISTYKAVNNYYTVYPATHNTGFTVFDLKDSVDFALTPKPNVNDLEVQLLPLSTPRPGFDVTYRIITKNVGTTTINNTVIGLKKDSRQSYLDASRSYSGIQADSIWWGPFTLNAFDIDTLYISLTLDTPPTLNNGDTLSLRVTANPVINDSSVANNKFSIKEIVRGSFDPNDKTEIHAGTLSTTQYANGEYLQYKIRFQNTGTDTAFFITVKDTLQAKLDFNSLEIVSASHPYTFKLIGNVAIWDFKKILLPDSTTDEAGSHGFILFKIKPKTGLTIGDEFTNKAAIYFDYNLPVITNQDKTVIGTNAGICPGGNISFVAGITGNSYQWQVNAGGGFTNLTNGGIYSGVNTPTLLLTAPTTGLYGYRYRCVVNGNINSPENKLRFSVRWKGTAGTAWENAANWDCGILPNAQTEVIIPAGVTYLLISSNASCYSLRLSPGSIVTIKTGFKLMIAGIAN